MNSSWPAACPWEPQRGECPAEADEDGSARLVRLLVHGVLLNTLCVGGLLGNLLAALVLTRRSMRSAASLVLTALAAADSALLLCAALLFGLPALAPASPALSGYSRRVRPLLAPALFPLALAAQTCSVYLTVLVTLERWVAVCRPFRARALCTASRARCYVAAAALFSLGYNAPKFLEVGVCRLDESTLCATATAFRSERYVAVYVHWMYLVVMYAVPFSLLAVLNARIAMQVRRAARERARLSRGRRRELGVACMLLGVVGVFFVCNLVPLVSNAVETFAGDGDPPALLDPLVQAGNLLVTLNSGVNFLVYVSFGRKFRRVFLDMVRDTRAELAARLCGRGRSGTGAGAGRRDDTRDDSCASCGERGVSLRLVRASTLRTSAPTLPPAPLPALPATPPTTDLKCSDL